MKHLMAILAGVGFVLAAGGHAARAGTIAGFTVNNSSRSYILHSDAMANGVTAYTDRTYTWQTVPAYLAGGDYVQTPNDDRGDGDLSIDLTFSQAGTLYGWFDDRVSIPSWVTGGGWSDTGDAISLGGGTQGETLSIYQKALASGTHAGVLGPAGASGRAMYGFGAVAAGPPTPPTGLVVDLDAAGGPLQSSYTSWNPSHSDGGALNQSATFAEATLSTDGTVDVTMTTAGNTYERNYSAVTGPLAGQTNLLQDLVFFNNRQSGNNYYEVQLDDLKAGNYQFTAYHVATNALNGDATVDILLNGADTGMDVTLLNTTSPSEARSSVVNFAVANDNDPITIRYANPTQNHFGLNGFELDSVEPPPPGLFVDLDGQTGPTQDGYTRWDPPGTGTIGALNESMSFPEATLSTDGTVDVTMTTAGNTYERNYGSVTGPLAGQTDLLKDLVFFNNDLGGSNFYEVQLDDLKAGDYQFTAYHVATNALNGDATVEILLNGADTGMHVTLQNTNSPAEARASVVNFTVANDNDPITIRYANPTQDHFGLNAFELIVPEPPPADLLVDLNGQSGPNQSGYASWNFADGFSGTLSESKAFDFAGATSGVVQVHLNTTTTAGSRNYGIDNVTDPGNLTIPDVWRDHVFFNNNTSGTMTLTLEGLKAGTYDFTSYSYADNLAGNDEGTASVSVDTGSGFVDTLLDVTMIAGSGSTVAGSVEAADLDVFSTLSFQFTVASDGDTVSILFDDLTGGDTFGLNGFELRSAATAVPEPSTFVLAALGLLGLGWFGRRRRPTCVASK